MGFGNKVKNSGKFLEKMGKSALIIGAVSGQPEFSALGAGTIGAGKLTQYGVSLTNDLVKTSKLLKRKK
jgi:hypothetical protein